jgi:hypothetical protein
MLAPIFRRNKMDYIFHNHWKDGYGWIELEVLKIVLDYKEPEYRYLEIIILNLEFKFTWEIKNEN